MQSCDIFSTSAVDGEGAKTHRSMNAMEMNGEQQKSVSLLLCLLAVDSSLFLNQPFLRPVVKGGEMWCQFCQLL